MWQDLEKTQLNYLLIRLLTYKGSYLVNLTI